ncbi:hypothetical protein [Pseudogemmobacter blasticus]|uniref:hypothetical protein n=1 Tax=Fuscovulum blasticum TaxID=1075 RepID=UPI0015E78DEF|nr:hypothetical protein [Fuscovulum blasticum]
MEKAGQTPGFFFSGSVPEWRACSDHRGSDEILFVNADNGLSVWRLANENPLHEDAASNQYGPKHSSPPSRSMLTVSVIPVGVKSQRNNEARPKQPQGV